MIKRLGIVGSGIMGSGIAEVATKAGIEVFLRSRKQATADAMVAALAKSLDKQVEKGRLDASERDQVLGRVTGTHDLHALAECDLVIESVVEDLDVKKEVFRGLDLAVKGAAIRDDIDPAMDGGCHFPMGPLALLDLVGLDTSLAILDALYDEFRDPNYAAVPTLRRMVAAGHLGRKSGQGFHDYRK